MKQRRILSLIAMLVLCAAMWLPGAAQAEILELPIDFSFGTAPQEKYAEGKMSYEDPSITVTRSYTKSKEYGCTYYVVDIKITNATQLRTESAAGGPNGFNTRQKVTVANMAKRTKAVVAVNGDYYAEHPGSLVLRQGVMFRNCTETYHDLLLIDEDGDFHVILNDNRNRRYDDPATRPMDVSDIDLTQVDGKKVINGIDFGPCIVLDGQPVTTIVRSWTNPLNSKEWEPAQRICIAQTGKLSYRIIAVAHYGLNIENFTNLVMSFGDVQIAYMLDGGDSSQIVFLGKKINNTQAKNVRAVPDCIYFASAYQPD
ncbi:MAG: phosphodiester glycosidase family protein [Clostridia bacterium]|nr:phosphodiester glycosidase family protein [Clostridia bacterium]